MVEVTVMKRAFYKGIDSRRRQEVEDSRLIYEDQNQVANLPDRPVYHTFDADRYVEKFRPGYDEIEMIMKG